jgi:hypothetical protein
LGKRSRKDRYERIGKASIKHFSHSDKSPDADDLISTNNKETETPMINVLIDLYDGSVIPSIIQIKYIGCNPSLGNSNQKN